MTPHRRQPSSSPAPRRARAGRTARTSRSRPARRARLLTRRAKLNAARDRRGVLLLVVLSLLVLFMMVGTAFIITAKQSEKVAKATMKSSVRLASEAAQTQLLDEVLLQVLRDTNNPHSSLRFHSLLGDMYGNEGIKTQVAAANWATAAFPLDGTNPTGGQILELVINTDSVRDLAGIEIDAFGNFYDVTAPPPNVPRLGPYDNAYNGRVLTFLSGPARGCSTRIVGFIPPNRLRVMNFNIEDGTPVSNPVVQIPVDSRLLINGRPFSGTGFGFDRTTTAHDAPKLRLVERINADSEASPLSGELALLPNNAFINVARLAPDAGSLPGASPTAQQLMDSAGTLLPGAQLAKYFNSTIPQHVTARLNLANQIGPAGIGGANESYDAVDYQNMALAMIPGVDATLMETVVSVADLADPGFSPFPTQLGYTPPPTPGNSNPPTQPMIIPSWHRPELINYWANGTDFAATNIRDSNLARSAMALRRILMRPNWLDHPNFTGSNPEFAAIANTNNMAEWGQKLARMVYGPWDVDNDNDGLRDSIWVDVGLPVMAGPNGKLVKPLAAILIVDMDGRLNVNAHGTCDLAQVGPSVTLAQPAFGTLGDDTTNITATARGTGYGPADITLRGVLGDNNFYRLLTGRYETGHPNAGQAVALPNGQLVGPGRYGHDDQTNFRPGRQLQYDFLSQIERAGWPQSSDTYQQLVGGPSLVSAFATPPDLRGRYGLAVNAYGQPVFEATLSDEIDRTNPWKNLVADSPYELNLSQKTAAGVQGFATGDMAADAPFAVAELERILRMYDADAGTLPGRLGYLSGILQTGNVSNARRLTTDSFDLPSPNVSMPHELEALVSTNPIYRRLPRSTAELFEIRVRAALPNNFPRFAEPLTGDPADPTSQAGQVRIIMRRILAPELADGQRLNINRPFGNGVDDNGNGVVDEPGETMTGIYDGGPATPLVAFDTAAGVVPTAAATFTNVDATFPIEAQEILEDGSMGTIDHRQYLARHLYTLALTLTAPEDYCQGGVISKRDEDLARRLAQWAVNIVDFRDADGIMTPFEYDINPFDGWHVDGKIGGAHYDQQATPRPRWVNVGTTGGNPIDHSGPDGQSNLNAPKTLVDDTIVWGAENPELAITETLAWHDRRTDDDMLENPYPETGDRELMFGAPAGTTPDDDFDQLYRPRGAAFVELYNPSEPRPGASADTHAFANANVSGKDMRVDLGVNLAATSLDLDNDPSTPDPYRSPVWRMLVHKRWQPNVNDPIPAEQAARWDPDYPDHTDPLLHPVGSPDRSVYFAGFDPAELRLRVQDPNVQWDDDGVAFFNDIVKNPVPPVRPGRYMVVGSGQDRDNDGVYEAPIGDRKRIGDNKRLRSIALDTRPRPDKVRMIQPSGAAVADPAWNYLVQSPAESANVVNPIAGIAATSVADVAIIDQVFDLVDNYDDAPKGVAPVTIGSDIYKPRTRRFTLSEPARGYVTSFNGSHWSDADDSYTSATGFPAIDIPLDGPISEENTLSSNILRDQLDRQGADVPPHMRQIDEVLTKIREDQNPTPPKNPQDPDPGASHSLIYLQRLANPLIPWNPMPAPGANIRANGHNPELPVNVYMTVDSNSANLTVFNSRGQQSPAKRAFEENDMNTNEAMRRFASHERGYTAFTADAALETDPTKMASLWSNELPSIRQERNAAGAADLKHGAVSRYRRLSLDTPDEFPIYGLPYHTLGFTNTTYQNRTLIPAAIGAGPETDDAISRKMKPKLPFDWLTWNNRPFISGNELLVVPRSRSSQMLREVSSYNAGSPYEADSIPRQHRARQQRPFGHLANYFLNVESDELVDPVPNVPTHLYRVLEYVHTPSLYIGSQSWLNPAGVVSTATNPINDSADPRLSRQAPFNSISEFRDPGRVNLNTISSGAIWGGLFHGAPTRNGNGASHIGPEYADEFVKFRRGYDAVTPTRTGEPFALDPSSPTLFAKPYRSPDAGTLVPLTELMPSAGMEGIESTLLRATAPAGGVPGTPLYASESTRKFDDASRSPYFNFGPMIRLDNLTTTRSNVYAVWVTIGFFEVEEAPAWSDVPATERPNYNNDIDLYKKVYPDGYKFGREDGVDVGNVRRLRSFYIIDRTLPAGYEPGADHNVDNTIRLRRRIE